MGVQRIAPQYHSVREIATDIVGKSIKPMAREAGFKKVAFNFYRRIGDLIQVVNIQLNRWNVGTTGGFYVNVGISFDKLRELARRPIDEKPRGWDWDFSRRMEHFCLEAPQEWLIDKNTDVEATAAVLSADFKIILHKLDEITSIQAFIESDLAGVGSGYGLLAKLFYVLDDMPASRHWLQRESAFFADRRGASIPELIERYHFDKFKET
ncbi:MAG TPA: DUF4304 domain-containing protein [Aggregatilineales bacterium]|nr:DUF4304 domain-containing protein [Aggregatilineales bacterium]